MPCKFMRLYGIAGGPTAVHLRGVWLHQDLNKFQFQTLHVLEWLNLKEFFQDSMQVLNTVLIHSLLAMNDSITELAKK